MSTDAPKAPGSPVPADARQPPPFGLWELLGLLLIFLILAGGFFQKGYAPVNMGRATMLLASALCGVWALGGLAMGRWRLYRGQPAFWLLMVLVAGVVWSGLQLVPLPSGLVVRLSPTWGEVRGIYDAAGMEFPARVPFAVAPEAGQRSWNLLVGATGFLLAALALASRRMGSALLIFMVAGFALLEGWVGLVNFVIQEAPRARGALFNPNHHAAAVLMGLPLAGALVAVLHHPSGRQGFGRRSSSDRHLLLMVLLLVSVVGWLVSFSRASLVFGVVAVGGWLVLEAIGPRREHGAAGKAGAREARRGLPVLQVVALATVLLVFVGFTAVYQSFSERFEERDEHLMGRIQLWDATFAGLRESRFLGVGPGGTEFALNRFLEGTPMRKSAVWAHNDWLQVGAELGVPGLLVVAVPLFFLLRTWRARAAEWRRQYSHRERLVHRAALAGLITVLLHSLVDFPLRIPSAHHLFLLVMALWVSVGPLRFFAQISRMSRNGGGR